MGTEYKTEIDGYSQIISHGGSQNNPSYWTVKSKAGQVMTYGGSTGNASLVFSGKGTIAWAVENINDTTGNNPVRFSYDVDNNSQYLRQVNYAGNRIGINYQSRSDVIKSMSLGQAVIINKIMSSVDVSQNSQVLRNYKLHYQKNSNYNHSILSSVEQCQGGSCYEPITFDYESAAFNYSAVLNSKPSRGHGGEYSKESGDFNGDGVTDLALTHWSSNYGWIAKIAMGKGDGTFATASNSGKLHNGSGSDEFSKHTGDFNSDGLTDLALIHWSSQYGWISRVALSQGDGTFTQAIGSTMSAGHGGAYSKEMGDFNGDGITDLALTHWSSDYGWIAKIAMGKGDGTFAAATNSGKLHSGSGSDEFTQHAGDFNSDGLTDLALIHWSSQYGWRARIALSQGDGTFTQAIGSTCLLYTSPSPRDRG